jgi:hypothetical protein
MKTIRSLFTLAVISAGAFTLTAEEPLSTPHQKSDQQIVVATGHSPNLALNETALGNAGRTKAGGTKWVRVSTVADPNLIACKRLGKASCPKMGTLAPCCQAELASCK